MTSPRAMTVKADEPGFYHCVSRCVRRAWLCGDDPYSGKNFDHRREWVEARLVELANTFAVGVYAWAVMSNHTHVVLCVDPKRPWNWSDEEVARRWAGLSRVPVEEPEDARRLDARVSALVADRERLEVIRGRLGSLSWFMASLNETIARMANAEDGCTGRFWEGRFKCQALIDDEGVLAAMAYVDLNPIRAGICETLAESDFTTIQLRLATLESGACDGAAKIDVLAGEGTPLMPQIALATYIAHVDWTGRCQRADKRGSIPIDAPRVLDAIRASPDWWLRSASGIESRFGSAIGLPASLRAHAVATARSRFLGVGLSC